MADIPINKLTQDSETIDDTLIKSYYFVTGYTFGGTVAPTNNPLTEEVNVFYFATTSGTYTNFGNIEISEPGFIYYTIGTGYTFQAFSFSGSGISGVTSVNSKTGTVSLTTDDIPEGTTNKYFSGTVPTDISDLTDNSNLIGSKAAKTNVLLLDNIVEYAPTGDYNPTTKKYVDDAISSEISSLSSIGTADMALDVNWATATPPPTQTPTDVSDHINDSTIHFTEAEIDKYTRAEVDSKDAILQAAINANALAISNLDAATEDEVLSHIYNTSVHFTKDRMLDYVVANYNIENNMASSSKKTGVDSGTFGDMAVTDDYLYLCVSTGDATTAIWKKILLYET